MDGTEPKRGCRNPDSFKQADICPNLERHDTIDIISCF